MSEQRRQFEDRVEELVARFEREVDPDEWVTRRYPKRLRDGDRSVYELPALYLQKGPVKLLLDPISYDVVGAEGVADIYLMPAYDPTVSLFFEGGQWLFYFNPMPEIKVPEPTTGNQPLPLTTETINQTLNLIADHAVPTV